MVSEGPPRADALIGVRSLFANARRADPKGVRIGLTLLFGSSVLRPLFPLLFKLLIDAVTSGNVGSAFALGVSVAVVSALGGAAGSYSSMYLWNVWERMTIVIDEQLVALTTRLGLLDRLE